MKKGIIIVKNVPEKCNQCMFWFGKATMPVEYRCMASQRKLETIDGKPDWCPIKDMLERWEICGRYPQPGKPVPSYRIGWNRCLDEIEKISLKIAEGTTVRKFLNINERKEDIWTEEEMRELYEAENRNGLYKGVDFEEWLGIKKENDFEEIYVD